MNKKILPIASIAIIAVIAVALFFNNNQSSLVTDSQNNSSEVMGDETANDSSTSGTLLSLLKLGKSYKCTFDTTDEIGGNTKGTVYVASSGDKFNGEFNITSADGTTVDGKVIRDGEYNYVWTSLQTQGFKSEISEEDDSLFSDDAAAGINSEEFDFNCAPWTVEIAKFTPPSDIEFVDISAQMEQIEEAAGAFAVPGEDADRCAACNLLPKDLQSTCLESLECN